MNFVDHDETGEYAGLHVRSDSIDAYFEPAPGSNVRDICGTADTNLFGTVSSGPERRTTPIRAQAMAGEWTSSD